MIIFKACAFSMISESYEVNKIEKFEHFMVKVFKLFLFCCGHLSKGDLFILQ